MRCIAGKQLNASCPRTGPIIVAVYWVHIVPQVYVLMENALLVCPSYRRDKHRSMRPVFGLGGMESPHFEEEHCLEVMDRLRPDRLQAIQNLIYWEAKNMVASWRPEVRTRRKLS